ncbi:MAG: hypothetical protein ABUS79_00995 [Pseudomonadota bacterium]
MLVLCLEVAGCGGGTDSLRGDANAGAGGGAGAGGASGASGGGGADGGAAGADGGGAAGATDQASCLSALLAACPEQGACRYVPPDGGGPTRYCYENGVQVEASHTGSCAGDSHTVVTVRKPNGSLCYTYEAFQGYICESTTAGWKDASGAQIGIYSSSIQGTTFQCRTEAPAACTGACSSGPVFGSMPSGCAPTGCP